MKFLLDSGVMYTLLPLEVWRAIGLRPTESVNCHLDDGTQVERKVSECQIALAQGKWYARAMLGEKGEKSFTCDRCYVLVLLLKRARSKFRKCSPGAL